MDSVSSTFITRLRLLNIDGPNLTFSQENEFIMDGVEKSCLSTKQPKTILIKPLFIIIKFSYSYKEWYFVYERNTLIYVPLWCRVVYGIRSTRQANIIFWGIFHASRRLCHIYIPCVHSVFMYLWPYSAIRTYWLCNKWVSLQ